MSKKSIDEWGMSKVIIDKWVWDAVCNRYAELPLDDLPYKDQQ